MWKKLTKPNNWLCEPCKQELESSVCDSLQWVFQITVEEFWAAFLCKIVVILPPTFFPYRMPI